MGKHGGYGYVPDSKDNRDLLLSYPMELREAGQRGFVAATTDSLRPLMPPVYDQGQLGSCTANAIGAALEYQQREQGEQSVVPSRLFIYYEERKLEGTLTDDAGAEIRDGMKVVAKVGAPPESDWPYDISKFADTPPPVAYTDATPHRSLRYYRVRTDAWDLVWCIKNKYPVVFGFTVYESFESDAVAQTGLMPMPASGEQVVGGHAVLAVGYDHEKKLVEVRNSWGDGWGDHGYFWMPYDYFNNSDLVTDIWTIRRAT